MAQLKNVLKMPYNYQYYYNYLWNYDILVVKITASDFELKKDECILV